MLLLALENSHLIPPRKYCHWPDRVSTVAIGLWLCAVTGPLEGRVCACVPHIGRLSGSREPTSPLMGPARLSSVGVKAHVVMIPHVS